MLFIYIYTYCFLCIHIYIYIQTYTTAIYIGPEFFQDLAAEDEGEVFDGQVVVEECPQDPAVHDEEQPQDLDGWVIDDDSDDDNVPAASDTEEKGRLWLLEKIPAFCELHGKGLAQKPPGGGLAVHLDGRQWRSYVGDSKRFGRTWGGKTGRTCRSALVEVLIEAWRCFCTSNPGDKLAMKHLLRLQKEE